MSCAAKQDIHVEEGVKIKRQSERAVLLVFENGEEAWVPLTVCEIEAMGRDVYRVWFEHWFAIQEGLA